MIPNREGPKALSTMYEGQIDLLGLPASYVRTMILPEEFEPRRVPDEVVASSAIFKAPNIIEDLPSTGRWRPASASTAPAGASGESTVFVFPGIKGAIWHSPVAAYAQTQVNAVSAMYAHTSKDDGGAKWMSHALRIENTGFLPRTRANGVPHIQLTRTQAINQSMSVALRTNAGYSANVILRIAWNTAGVFTSADFLFEIRAGTGRFDITPGVLPPLMDSLAIGILHAPGLPDALEFSVFDSATWTSDQNNCTMYDIRDIDQLVDMPLTYMERPTALSALVTYMGSTLANGGNIAGARLPMSFDLGDVEIGDYYAAFASYPIYAADYPLKDGAYAWWCPDSEQEYFFRPHGTYISDDLETVSYLAFALKRAEVDQTVRLRVDLHVETQTRSSLFTSQVSDSSPSFPRALELAKLLPAVTYNDEHKSLLGKAWAKVKSWVSKPANWVNLLRTGATALSAL